MFTRESELKPEIESRWGFHRVNFLVPDSMFLSGIPPIQFFGSPRRKEIVKTKLPPTPQPNNNKKKERPMIDALVSQHTTIKK
jgi:hypothetical protein